MSSILVVGATSAMAMEAIKLFAERKDSLVLVGRSQEKLEQVAADARARGAQQVSIIQSDLADCSLHERVVADAENAFGDIDKVLIAYGTLPDQAACECDFAAAEQALQTNFVSVVSWCSILANRMEKRGHGVIAVIGSVAGDRGRQSNYIYGSAKGGLAIYLQGLRNRLFPRGVQVVTIKPGFVDTPMTAHIKKGPLFVGADVVGRGIVQAMDKGSAVVYLPWFWCFIMLVIKHIPEVIFKRLKL